MGRTKPPHTLTRNAGHPFGITIIIPEAGDFVNRNLEKTRVPRFRGRRSGLEHEKIPENGDEQVSQRADPPGRDPPKRGEVREMEQKTTLRELREECGLSRADVAAALGVSYQAISNYEAGIRRVSLEHILALAGLYECSAEEVIRAQLSSIGIGESE